MSHSFYPKKKFRIGGAGLGVAITTIVFAVIGGTFLIIGYYSTILSWMRSVGITLLILSVVPVSTFAFYKIKQKLEE